MTQAILQRGANLFAAAVLLVSLSYTPAQGSTHSASSRTGVSSQTIREVDRPVVTGSSSEGSGLLAWLESLLPGGIRFTGPAIGSKNQPEVLATANCYQSGVGLSCIGFKNLEEYLAAIHVSRNLGIPFERLKAKMQSGRTLPQAIKELRPGTNGRIEAWRAEQQAQQALRDFSS